MNECHCLKLSILQLTAQKSVALILRTLLCNSFNISDRQSFISISYNTNWTSQDSKHKQQRAYFIRKNRLEICKFYKSYHKAYMYMFRNLTIYILFLKIKFFFFFFLKIVVQASTGVCFFPLTTLFHPKNQNSAWQGDTLYNDT